MAFDLTARLRLKDEMTNKLKSVANSLTSLSNRSASTANAVERTGRSMTQAGASSGGLRNNLNSLSSTLTNLDRHLGATRNQNENLKRSLGGVGSMASGFNMIKTSVLGLAGAYVTFQGAKSIFDSTIVAAAKSEMNLVTLQGMFNGQEKQATAFYETLKKRAAVSMFSMEDFVTSGRMFVPVTKNLPQLEQMTKLAERLGASNPQAGLEGAAFAMREMFSGDGQSMIERFNMKRSDVNAIKNLPIEQQLKAFDRLLSKMGFTQTLLDKQAKTGYGQYAQAVDKVKIALANMGKEGLDKIKPLLERVNKSLDGKTFQKFQKFGSQMMGDFYGSVVKGINASLDYVSTHFINNPKFNKLTTFGAKISFIFDELTTSFDKWYAGGGKKSIEKISQGLGSIFMDVLVFSLEKALPKLIDIGVKLGYGIIKGMAKGLLFHEQSKKTKEQNKALEKILNPKFSSTGGLTNIMPSEKTKGHAGGLSYVPYDNYPARLHKGERVLTKGENESTRSGSSPNVTITGNTFNVRKESDIDEIARKLAHAIVGYGGAVSIG